MKNLLFVALAVFTVAGLAGQAEAQNYTRDDGYRYRATYRDFDRGFSRHYGYREQCFTEYSYGRTVSTCYEIPETEVLYVQEQHWMDGGVEYSRVVVRRYSYDSEPYAEYWVRGGVVHRRDYHCHSPYPYYRNSYYYDDYYTYYPTTWVYIQLDWDKWEDKMFIGAYTALVGVDIILHADSDADTVTGLIVAGLGSLSISLAEQQRVSELQAEIAKAHKETSLDSQTVR